jgi:hypothetical protein
MGLEGSNVFKPGNGVDVFEELLFLDAQQIAAAVFIAPFAEKLFKITD